MKWNSILITIRATGLMSIVTMFGQ